MFYKITGDTGGGPNVYMQALNNESADIQSGRFIATPPEHLISELPFRFRMKVRRNEDDDTRQVPRMSAYYYATELMQKKLVNALQSAGVDNLQVFPAVITEDGQATIIEDYVVVNVVGLVSCAVLGESDSIPFADGYFFNDLVIDPAKTNNLLMFRLAESKMDVIVHARVASELDKHRFPYLVLTPLKHI